MSKAIHGGNIYEFAKAHNLPMEQILDFSANINPIGMSPIGLEAMTKALTQCIYYPDIHNEELMTVISERFNLPTSQIALGNGASELLYALMKVLPCETVYVPAPGFSEYTKAAQCYGKTLRTYSIDSLGGLQNVWPLPNTQNLNIAYDTKHTNQLHGTKYTSQLHGRKYTSQLHVAKYASPLDDIKSISPQDGTERDKLLYNKHDARLLQDVPGALCIIGNPNNPDGSLIDTVQFKEYVAQAQAAGLYILVDESFIEFTDETQTVRQLCKSIPNLLVLHSLTKFYAVPGLRLGALFGSEKVIDLIQASLPAWSVNRLAQVYGAQALQDTAYVKESKDYVKEEKQRFYMALQEFPFLQVIEPSVNFILLRWLPKEPTLGNFMAYMNRHHIMLRNCEAYEGLGTGWFRLAIKKKEENNVLLSYVKEYGNEHNLFSTSWTD